MTSSPSVLVVEPALDQSAPLFSYLSAASLRVTVTDSFSEAKALLTVRPPAVLLTELKLGEFNGLHLVLRGKSVRPTMAALVMSPVFDAVMQGEADKMGATVLLKPLDRRELLAAICRTLARTSPDEQPLRPPFERRRHQRRAVDTLVVHERRQADRRLGLAGPQGTSGVALSHS